jgi:hypothetical protein
MRNIYTPDWMEEKFRSLRIADDERSRLIDPKFPEASPVHDWRNYVGENTRIIWKTLTNEQRAAIALDANERASNEEWD